jgi:hypothetical protein
MARVPPFRTSQNKEAPPVVERRLDGDYFAAILLIATLSLLGAVARSSARQRASAP